MVEKRQEEQMEATFRKFANEIEINTAEPMIEAMKKQAAKVYNEDEVFFT